jgi:hypothetical protein
MEQGEYTKAIAKFCKIRENRALKPSFSTIEGSQHTANVIASHFQSIYSGYLLQETDRTLPSLGNPTTPFEIETCPLHWKIFIRLSRGYHLKKRLVLIMCGKKC